MASPRAEQKSFCQNLGEQLSTQSRDLGKFLYNSEAGEVMGRDGGSWARIGLFYLIFYGFLAGFFGGMLSVFLTTLNVPGTVGDNGKPTTSQFLENQPGLTVVQQIYAYDKTDNDTIKKYVNQSAEYLKLFDGGCYSKTACPIGNTGYSGDTPCKYNTSLLNVCSGGQFGFDSATPCVFVKINKVFNWVPQNGVNNFLTLSCDKGKVHPAGYLISAFPYKGQKCYSTPPVAVAVPYTGSAVKVRCKVRGDKISVSDSFIAHRAYGNIEFVVGGKKK